MIFINRVEKQNVKKQDKLQQNSKIISPSKMKKFNQVSLEIEQIFQTWLSASGLEEKAFIEMVKNEEFRIDYKKTEIGIRTSFFILNNEVGIPLICNDLKEVKSYNMDLALLIMCFASKTDNDFIQDKYRKIIKNLVLIC